VRLYQRSADRRLDPPPVTTNDRAIVLVGVALWIVALALTLVFHERLADAGRAWWTWTALAGIAGGLLGLLYISRRRRS
jgi:LPXTG-motif cell wall-anchored protein